MINREDSALIARERQNRSPVNRLAAGRVTNVDSAKTAAGQASSKPPMRAASKPATDR